MKKLNKYQRITKMEESTFFLRYTRLQVKYRGLLLETASNHYLLKRKLSTAFTCSVFTVRGKHYICLKRRGEVCLASKTIRKTLKNDTSSETETSDVIFSEY